MCAFFGAKRLIIHRVFKLHYRSSSSSAELKGSTRALSKETDAFCGDSEIRAWRKRERGIADASNEDRNADVAGASRARSMSETISSGAARDSDTMK